MSRKPNFLALCLPLLAPASLDDELPGASPPDPEQIPPNIVLIVVDDWGLSDLDAMRSDDVTWNDLVAIDDLASRGSTWRNFYSQPICNTTRLSLMLGQERAFYGGPICDLPTLHTPDIRTTLASVMQDAGYTTATFGKWDIATDPDPTKPWETVPETYGFDHWRAWHPSNLKRCNTGSYFDWTRIDDGVTTQSTDYETEAVADAFVQWWKSTTEPKFGYVCFQAPHSPFHDPPAHLLPFGTPPLETARQRYEAMLVALDTQLARILRFVDLSRSYVFVVGDNGTPIGATLPGQDMERVKATTFEDGINVPMIAVGPGIPPGETLALGHVVDFGATFADIAGIDLNPGELPDSVSLLPVLEDPAARTRTYVVSDLLARSMRDTCVILDTPEGLLKGRFGPDPETSVMTESYYALEHDPGERYPLDLHDERFSDDILVTRNLSQLYYRPRSHAISMNGANENPPCFTNFNTPRLGKIWSVDVDSTFLPGVTHTGIVFSRGFTSGRPGPFGETLVDESPGVLLEVTLRETSGGLDHFEFPMRSSVSLIGAVTYAQGFLFKGIDGDEALLCNAVGLTFGY